MNRFGRKNFLESQQVAYSYENICWPFLRYYKNCNAYYFYHVINIFIQRLVAFDCPPSSDHFKKSSPFELRYNTLLEQLDSLHPFIVSYLPLIIILI